MMDKSIKNEKNGQHGEIKVKKLKLWKIYPSQAFVQSAGISFVLSGVILM